LSLPKKKVQIPRSLRALEKQSRKWYATVNKARIGSTDAEHLRWLLAFAQRTPDEFFKLSKRQREALEAELRLFAEGTEAHEGARPPSPSLRAMMGMAADVRHGIHGLVGRSGWGIDIRGPFNINVLGYGMERGYDGDLRTRVLLTAADLLEREGFPPLRSPRVRRCARIACQKLFVAVRRQIYCSGRCSLLERTRKFRSGLSKEEMSRRRHEWYKRRVAKHQGEQIARHVRRRKEK